MGFSSFKSILPKYRHIDEHHEATLLANKYGTPLPQRPSSAAAAAKEKDADSFNVVTTVEQDDDDSYDNDRLEGNDGEEEEDDAIEWEIRDEAGRKWWSLFNEHEYKKSTKHKDGQRWYHWYDINDTKEERRLISKLDFLVCFYSFTMYWVKYLDQANINNAYVSGMKQDLNMTGNDLNNTNIVYTVGSIIFQIPCMYLIHKVPIHYLLPFMDVGWGMFTLAIFRAKTVRQLQAYRFFVGVFESAFYPTIHYLIGSWYKPHEYNRRGGFYYFGQMLGLLTSGFVQSSAYEHLSGVGGLAGWRWLFVIDVIITIPIAIIGFFTIPGTPNDCYSLWLSDRDIYLARHRLREAGIGLKSHGPKFFDWALWKKVLTSWQFYWFTIISIFLWNNSNASSGAYILWLKSLNKYSIPLVNQYSTITPALGIVWITVASVISDLFRSRFLSIMVTQSLNLVGNIILSVWYLPQGVVWFAFCLQYFGWAISVSTYSWGADASRENPQVRAIILVTMNMIGQASTALTAAFVWQTEDAPRFLKGYSFTAASAFSMMVTAVIVLVYYKKQERKWAYQNHILLYNSDLGEVPPVPPTKSSSTTALRRRRRRNKPLNSDENSIEQFQSGDESFEQYNKNDINIHSNYVH